MAKKPQFGQLFGDFEASKISRNCKFFWKTGLIQIEGHIQY